MSIFKGAAVAIITPFTEDDQVNYQEFGRIIEDQIAGGTDAIVVCGTTGESSTLSHAEHIDCMKFVVNQVAGRVPVIAGTGSNSTKEAIYLSTEAEKAGADGLLLVSPYYNKATQKGLYTHFKMVADAVSIPILLYNIPGRTGVNILPETIVSLCTDVENIVGVKDATGNIAQLVKLMHLAQGKIDVYSGNDDQIVPLLSLGGKGVISVLSNVAPRYTHEICTAFFQGDHDKSSQMQLNALPLIDALFSEVNPIPVKAAMNMLGYQAGECRRPLSPMEEGHSKVLEAELRKAGLLK